jgi:SAM-dependent methyltransferase
MARGFFVFTSYSEIMKGNMMRPELHEANRRAWNDATRAHNSHKADQTKFLRNGGSTLFPEELELLGDITELSLLHLQCNAGQDTLSLARHGAIVTGVDISDEAIAFATSLARDSGIPATFERADVYDWLERAAQGSQHYDIVFSSYGAIFWLSDIRAWARGIGAILKPGARFVLVEFHPFAMTLDDSWNLAFDYFGAGQPRIFADGIGDYVADSGAALAPSGYLEGVKDFKNPHPTYQFSWGIGDLVTALIEAGLTITVLREYPYANGCQQFDGMREIEGQRMIPPEGMPNVPLMYSIAARKI